MPGRHKDLCAPAEKAATVPAGGQAGAHSVFVNARLERPRPDLADFEAEWRVDRKSGSKTRSGR